MAIEVSVWIAFYWSSNIYDDVGKLFEMIPWSLSSFVSYFFCIRYYKSCLEPLDARYVTNELAAGGLFPSMKKHSCSQLLAILENMMTLYLQVVSAPCWTMVTSLQNLVIHEIAASGVTMYVEVVCCATLIE